MIVVICALFAAGCNALASILQKQAAKTVGNSVRLVRTPSWLAGIAALTGGFLFQATALGHGKLVVVQAVLVVELPLTLLVASLLARRPVGRRGWLGVLSISVGLAALLTLAGPTAGAAITVPSARSWVAAALATVGLMAALIGFATRRPGALRATLLGTAAGAGFALTAALMKAGVADTLERNPRALLTSWPTYAMVAAGLASLALLQAAFRAGPLVAVQPALTIGDPLISAVLGAALFGEQLRGGVLLVPELATAALIAYGAVVLSASTQERTKGDDPASVAVAGGCTGGSDRVVDGPQPAVAARCDGRRPTVGRPCGGPARAQRTPPPALPGLPNQRRSSRASREHRR